MANNDVLSKIILEAKSYKSISDIEKLVDICADLSMIPLQPLYTSLLSASTDQVAEILPKFSMEQRQAFLDLDLWTKDQIDVNSFEFWIEVYSKVSDLDLVQQFVETEDFLAYLKSRVNIQTFDTEDPEYPDHDFYFLTDDMLLLVEYSQEYRFPNELKYLIRNLYAKLGVEYAYSILFKIINDSYSMLQEKLYQDKKGRLREYGFVDYFEALEKTYAFLTYKQIDSFVLNVKSNTPELDPLSQNQSLHGSSLVSFDSEMENIIQELLLVKNEKRLVFLHFTFIRLINSTISINNAMRAGRIELTRIGSATKNFLELGLQKIKNLRSFNEDESVFDSYDFFDLYRVGSSLISIERKRISKSLKKTPFEKDDFEYFLGSWWASFLDNSGSQIPKVKSFGAGLQVKDVNSLSVYEFWKKEVTLFKDSLPFIHSFFNAFRELKKEGKLHDHFYLNYDVENIDFEAVLISSFINFSLGHFSGKDVNKMGVTISELKQFFEKYFIKRENEYILRPLKSEETLETIKNFIEMFGLSAIYNFEAYLYGVLSEHLSGYEFDTLSDTDFQHIGGPILLNTLTKN